MRADLGGRRRRAGALPDAVLLIRRAERAGDPWSGHMALPGGRREAERPRPGRDRDSRDRRGGRPAARARGPARAASTTWCPGPRSCLPIAVRPFVFSAARAARPSRSIPRWPAVRWVPLDHLLHPETYHSARLDIRGEPREFPAYRVDEAIVWGMTERILTGLLDQLRQ